MRCLYCGKELALLKRLTGGGDFCSDAHKQSYQEEYNRLALSRLLQAQNKGQPANKPSAPPAPPPRAQVALEEQATPADVVAVQSPSRLEAAAALEEPVLATDAAEESPLDTVVTDDGPLSVELPLSEEPEPVETAGFLFELAIAAAVPEETPYLEAPYVEAWLELSSGPAVADWELQNELAFTLSAADLLSLHLRPNASTIDYPAPTLELSPQAFPGSQPDPPRARAASPKKISNASRFPSGSAVAVEIAPNSSEPATDHGFIHAVEFDSSFVFGESEFLELPSTIIDFPAEDSDISFSVPNHRNGTSEAYTETPAGAGGDLTLEATPDPSPEAEPTPEADTPRASLEALSRLHQEMAADETAIQQAAGLAEDFSGPVAGTIEASPQEEAAPQELAEVVTDEPLRPDTATETAEPSEDASKPKFTTELFDVSLKTFPPAKPSPIGGDPLPGNIAPLLPRLSSLPLRPKVALATGYVPPSTKPAPKESKSPAPVVQPPAASPRAQAPSKSAPAPKPTARLTQPKQPTPAAKPAQPSTKPASKADPTKPLAKTALSQPGPAPEASEPKTEAPETAPEAAAPTPVVEPEKPSKKPEKPAAEIAKPPAAKPAPDISKPIADQAKPATPDPQKEDVPSFGIAQPANTSWLGSLKVKLGLAILILVIACAYFLGWGGKSSKSPTSNTSVSADGSGPSIIMGEGGWVEGWGGDPTGLHGGRQITIYRPSLKLSDYRLEFQGSIDAKSVGWVFRAADPENYYAMKLMMVSSGLSSKVALFKYLVANGKQTQVGRVPIDLAVQPDTVFNVRVDVRGPQFTTYIQGQQVDSWTDDQLKIGGAGFLNEREERGKVKSVSIRYLSGTGK